jgi:hypothetical protein
MNEDWNKVYTSTDFFKSELVRQHLIENGIEAVILNKQGYPYQIGYVEVYVKPDQFQQATDLIAESDV